MIDLMALDIAGTTVDEGGAVYHALRAAVASAARSPASDDDVRDWMGADKRAAIRGLMATVGRADLTGAEVNDIYDDFRGRLSAAYDAYPPRPVPGVSDLLARLRDRGVKVALTTGFPRDITDPLLARLGWRLDGELDAVVTVDEVASGRPAPYLVFHAMELTGAVDVRRVLVAGDTARDLEAGTRAGAGYVVGVLSGGQSRATLERAPHTHLLDSLADLAVIDDVRDLLGWSAARPSGPPSRMTR
jgi:phosphonatase-like hydrolase